MQGVSIIVRSNHWIRRIIYPEFQTLPIEHSFTLQREVSKYGWSAYYIKLQAYVWNEFTIMAKFWL